MARGLLSAQGNSGTPLKWVLMGTFQHEMYKNTRLASPRWRALEAYDLREDEGEGADGDGY